MSGASGRSASSGDPQPSRDRWTTLEPLIDAALELPREQRAAFLDRASGGDAPLRAELEGFLTECDRPDRMLDLPAAAIFSSLLDQGPLRLPTVLGERYRIEREIGHGGMATVYLAEDVRHERKVAVKVLHPELAAAVGAERFLAEIRMTAQLQHPHILPLHDSGETGGVLFYVMPYVEGGSLRRHMEREKQLPVEDALRIACEVASALDAAHRQGVIHRDIKPENILLQNGAALVADFGIALAVSTAASTRLTKSGLTVGTPQYMSPEQATGERAIDGRSDIYSLGAVLYEMLAGEPPFTGTTTTAVIAKLVALPAPSLRVVRPGVTVALDAVVARVLSREPADRYRTAGEFAEALASATPVSTPKAPSSRLSRHVARPSLLTIGAVATILTIAIMSRPWESRNSPNIATLADTTRLVILPLEHDLPVPLANGLDAMLYDAFSRFQGLRLVGHFQVRSGLVGKKLDAAITASELTRSFGAGRYVRAQIVPIADSFQVSAALYDVRRNEELYHASVRLDRQLKNVDSIFDALAGAVLLRRANANVERGTTVVPALQAFASGQAMLDEWDLPGADSLFGAALTYDRTYRRAGYWLAQVRAWQALPPSQWSAQADFSLADSGQLLPGERPLAHALVALGQQRYADACHIYERLKKDNDRDFMAWYGLGQCVEMDHAVVADSTSRSRWRFRSSYYRAILAYQRALVLLPLAHRGLQRLSYARLREMLFTSNTTPRQGIALGADSLRFFSRPEWRRDSIVFIPFIANNIPASPTSEEVDAIRRAVSYNRDVFQSIAATWAATLPASAGTKEALAVSLEMRGDPAAIDTLRSARRLTSDPNHRVRLASQEALLLFKFGFPNDHAALRRVRVESDSLLSIKAPASLESARALSSLAALTGKCAAVAELKRRIAQPRSDVVDAPRQVVAEWDAVEAKAALGCQSTRTSSFVEVNASIWSAQVKGAAAQRRAAAPLVLGRAVLLTFPLDSAWVARLSSPRSGGVLQAAHAILVGEHEAARRHLEISLTALLPGEITPDAIYPRARLWLMLADTSTSVQLLDRVLRDVRFLSPGLLDSPVQIGALVRVAMLRAEIAANRGDSQKAALLSTAVMDLWSGADPDLSPSLRAVSRFARQ